MDFCPFSSLSGICEYQEHDASGESPSHCITDGGSQQGSRTPG